jgi:hypothetical protein
MFHTHCDLCSFSFFVRLILTSASVLSYANFIKIVENLNITIMLRGMQMCYKKRMEKLIITDYSIYCNN